MFHEVKLILQQLKLVCKFCQTEISLFYLLCSFESQLCLLKKFLLSAKTQFKFCRLVEDNGVPIRLLQLLKFVLTSVLSKKFLLRNAEIIKLRYFLLDF